MSDEPGAAATRLNYAGLAGAIDDLLSSHPLPMALLDPDLKVLGISGSLAGFLPADGADVAGMDVDALIAALAGRGGASAPARPDPAAAEATEPLRTGQWRLEPVVTHDGRVLVPFNYPLASGNTQLVLMEPDRMTEVTDLGEVLDVAADAFAIFDEGQRLVQCNTQFVALLTYDPASPPPLGLTAREIVQQVVEAGTLLVGAGFDQPGMVDAMVAGLLTPDGATFEVEGKLGRIFLAATKPRSSGGHILTLRDVTDIRKAERQAMQAIAEILGPVQNPRYLMVRASWFGLKRRADYHAVPAAIGARKEAAERFAELWRNRVGSSKLVFTRTAQGRRTLLRARASSFAAGFQRIVDRRSVWL